AYCGKTIVEAIKNNWTNKEVINSNAYSPAFLFRLLQPNDMACNGGSAISIALELLKDKGAVPYSSISGVCTPTLSPTQLAAAEKYKIKDYMRLFDSDAPEATRIRAVKKAISEKKPVVFGMICPPSFHSAKDVWLPKEEPLTSYGGHAMCVVGYDDNKDGGSFEIQNSWGTGWGNAGYIWIKYSDFGKFAKYGFEFIDLPAPKPADPDLSGQIRLALADGRSMPASLYMSTRGLTIVPAKPAVGPLTLYQAAGNYTAGTRFRIYVSNNEPAYVYAFSSDATNVVTKIFPYDDKISAALTDKKNNFMIPDEDHFIEFDNQAGKDLLCVLYSKDELDMNDIIKKMALQTGSFNDRIFKVIGTKTVDPKNITFSKDNIGFQAFSNGKSIVPLVLEIEHK
ncbi:MAG: DUF4384 domain-containing protein, partial [Sphingobacteriales bacterium]